MEVDLAVDPLERERRTRGTTMHGILQEYCGCSTTARKWKGNRPSALRHCGDPVAASGPSQGHVRLKVACTADAPSFSTSFSDMPLMTV